jgi:hypothetical protein
VTEERIVAAAGRISPVLRLRVIAGGIGPLHDANGRHGPAISPVVVGHLCAVRTAEMRHVPAGPSDEVPDGLPARGADPHLLRDERKGRISRRREAPDGIELETDIRARRGYRIQGREGRESRHAEGISFEELQAAEEYLQVCRFVVVQGPRNEPRQLHVEAPGHQREVERLGVLMGEDRAQRAAVRVLEQILRDGVDRDRIA